MCLGSHSQEPSGDGNWDELHHRRTEDFTMEEVHVVGGMAAGLGGKTPVGLWGKAPVEGLGDEEKFEISLQLLTLSCRKFRI